MAEWEHESRASAAAAEDLFGDWKVSSPRDRAHGPTRRHPCRRARRSPPRCRAPRAGPPRRSRPTPRSPSPIDPSVAVSRPIRTSEDRSEAVRPQPSDFFGDNDPTEPAPVDRAPNRTEARTPAYAGSAPAPATASNSALPHRLDRPGRPVDEQVRTSDDIMRASDVTALPTAAADPAAGTELARLLAKVEARLRELRLTGAAAVASFVVPAPRSRRRRRDRRRPRGDGGGHHPGESGTRRARRRQGRLSSRQDLRRRPDHLGAPRARRSRARPDDGALVGRRRRGGRLLAVGPVRSRSPFRATAPATAPSRAAESSTPVWWSSPARPERRSSSTPRSAGRHRTTAPSGSTSRAWATSTPNWAIGADGMWSPLRKALGVADPTYRGDWHAFRQYLTDVSPRASRELIVWFDADLLPGYAWSFPIAGGVRQRRLRDPPRDQLQGRRHGGALA